MSGFQVTSPDPLGRMTTIREPDASAGPVMPLVAILDEEGQMTGITCPLNVGVDPHDIEGCEDLLESYFMQVYIQSLEYTHLFELFICTPVVCVLGVNILIHAVK